MEVPRLASNPKFRTSGNQKLKRVINFNVEISDLKLFNHTKTASRIIIDFAGKEFITDFVKTSNPVYNSTFQFEYSTDDSTMKDQVVTFTVEDKAVFGNVIVGFIKLDLFSVASGCQSYRLPGMKMKKGNAVGRAKWTIAFNLKMECVSNVEINLKEITCKRLRNAGLINPLFKDWKNDSYLQINLYELDENGVLPNDPISTVTSSVCYNTSNPSWLTIPPLNYFGSLFKILHLVIEVKAIEYRNNALLGTCFINVSKYYSLDESERPVILDLMYLNAPYGEFEGFLSFKYMPPFAQMLNGIREADKILDSQPLINEVPQPPKKLVMLKIGKPIFESPVLGEKELILSNPLGRQDLLLVKTVLKYTQEMKSNDNNKRTKAISELFKFVNENENEFCSRFNKFGNLLEILMDFIKSSNKELRVSASKVLGVACKDSKNVELLFMNGMAKDLLEILKKNANDSNAYYITSILVPLSIRDDNTQSLFLTHSSIPILLDIMSSTKKVMFLKNIVKILGHLCYGSDSARKNKEVIKNSNGLNLIINTAVTHPKTYSEVVMTLKIISYNDLHSHLEVVKSIITNIYMNLKDHNNIFTLMKIHDEVKVVAENTTDIDRVYIDNLSKVIIPFLTSPNEELSKKVKDTLLHDPSILNYINPNMSDDLASQISSKDPNIVLTSVKLIFEILSSTNGDNQLHQFLIATLTKTAHIKDLSELFCNLELDDSNYEVMNHIIFILKATFKHVIALHNANIAQFSTGNVHNLVNRLDGPFIQKLMTIHKKGKQDIKIEILKFASFMAKHPLTNFILVKPQLIEMLPDLVSASNSFVLRKVGLKFISNLSSSVSKRSKKEITGILKEKINEILNDSHIILCNYAVIVIKNLCLLTPNRHDDQLIDYFVNNNLIERMIYLIPKSITNKLWSGLISILQFLVVLMKKDEYSSKIDFDFVVETIFFAQEQIDDSKYSDKLTSLIDSLGIINRCTSRTNQDVQIQEGYECRTCALTGKLLICTSCSNNCHLGHEVVPVFAKEFSCTCGNSKMCRSKKLSVKARPLKVCTREFGSEGKYQYAFKCRTCFLTNDDAFICGVCISDEHNNHFVQNVGVKKFTCCCYTRNFGCKLGLKSVLEENMDLPSKENPPPPEEEEEEENICIVCFMNRKDTAFYKCGHVACCNDCAKELHRRNGKCPICRQVIHDIMKLYEV